MTRDNDAFWDELGVSWRASIPEARLISSRLEVRARLQSALLTAGTIVGSAVSLLSLGLAVWALWIGWSSQAWNFLTRGLTLATISLLAIMATLALRMRNESEARSLSAMLQVSVARTERLISALDLGCLGVVILALGGTVGYALRVQFGRPPAVSPIEDLLALALAGLALLWYRQTQAHAARRYRHLSQVFSSSDEIQ